MKPLKVVIVDDEAAHLRLIKRAINKALPSASVDFFEEAGPCLESLDEISPDVIITDYLMAGMNGIEFIEALNRQNKDIPVIMITGQGNENIAVQAMKLGARDYLVKTPNCFTLLPSVIEKVLRERKLKESLRASEERYRASFDNSTDAINIFSEDRRFLDVNKKLVQFSGYSKEELLSMKLQDLYPESVKPATKERIQKLLQGEEVPVFETYLLTKTGEKRPVEIGITPLKDCYGLKIVFQSNVRDITERKRAEERIHVLSQQLMKAQEAERQRLSRDLHDHVAQMLSGAKIRCDTLFNGYPDMPERVRQRASELGQILEGAIASVRDLAYGLRPVSLDRLGLVRTVLQHCEEFSADTGIKVDFSAAGIEDLRLDPDTEIALYRLIEESLNNIRKHADATRAAIRLVASFPDIILRVEDNGKGFDVQSRSISAVSEKRMGLASMKERVLQLGGKMRIESREMQGTKIFIKVPVRNANSGQEDNHPDR